MRLTRFALLVLTLVSPAAAFGQSAAPAPAAVTRAQPAALDAAALEQKVDELLEAHAKVNDFHGSILLARNGKPLVAKGYGFANVEWRIPNTPDTRFRIGSITKQFTSMLIMQLREQGKVKVEDSVCVYVTPCPDAWKPVTIHHLLTHTSGIPSYTGIAAWRETNMVPKTVDQMVALFRDLPLQWVPGEKFAYNNSGYYLLGVVIETVTKKKYEAALQEMILDPLGLKGTGYDWPSTILPKRASGYQGRGPAFANAPPLDMQQPYAAGSMYSTVEDLLAWDQALYTEKLLPDAAKQLMWTPFKDGYAYGWGIRDASPATFGYKQIAHSGGINGFSSMIIRLPEINVTAIVLGNNAAAPAAPIARDLLALYFGQPYDVPAPKAIIPLDPKDFDQYVGAYQFGPNFVMKVSREGNRFITQATGQQPIEIFPMSETKFFPKEIEAELTFVKSADGTVTSLILTQSGRSQTAKKIQ
jgi:CubicO group peptidase (beta-lactamase class C family)